MLPITWLQVTKENNDLIKPSRSLVFLFFTRPYITDDITPIVINIQIYWYSFTHRILYLEVPNGSGQNHITNRLNFIMAIAFFSVTFSCMTIFKLRTIAILWKVLLKKLYTVLKIFSSHQIHTILMIFL